MNRKLHIFKDGVLQARTLTLKGAKEAAKYMTGDVRIVDARKPAVVARTVSTPTEVNSLFKYLNNGHK